MSPEHKYTGNIIFPVNKKIGCAGVCTNIVTSLVESTRFVRKCINVNHNSGLYFGGPIPIAGHLTTIFMDVVYGENCLW